MLLATRERKLEAERKPEATCYKREEAFSQQRRAVSSSFLEEASLGRYSYLLHERGSIFTATTPLSSASIL
jgi:hypothetical protein